jgi:hypothetical protein
MLATTLSDPVPLLYWLLALVYGVAGVISNRGPHKGLTVCYLMIAALHVQLGLAHLQS